MRSIKSILVVSILFLAIVGGNAFAAVDALIESSDSPGINDTFSITISLSGTPAVGAASLFVNFDKTLVTLESAVKPTPTPAGTLVVPSNATVIATANTNGYFKVGYANVEGLDVSTKTPLAIVTFKAKGTAGNAAFSFGSTSPNNSNIKDTTAGTPVDITGTLGTKTITIGGTSITTTTVASTTTTAASTTTTAASTTTTAASTTTTAASTTTTAASTTTTAASTTTTTSKATTTTTSTTTTGATTTTTTVPGTFKSGDADGNGTVNIYDALYAAKYDVGKVTEAELIEKFGSVAKFIEVANVDKTAGTATENKVDIWDALKIAQMSLPTT